MPKDWSSHSKTILLIVFRDSGIVCALCPIVLMANHVRCSMRCWSNQGLTKLTLLVVLWQCSCICTFLVAQSGLICIFRQNKKCCNPTTKAWDNPGGGRANILISLQKLGIAMA